MVEGVVKGRYEPVVSSNVIPGFVKHWLGSQVTDYPSFAIIAPCAEQREVVVPTAFAREYFLGNGGLINVAGNAFALRWRRSALFHKAYILEGLGWESFVKYRRVVEGDILLFILESANCFKILVFMQQGLEAGIHMHAQHMTRQPVSVQSIGAAISVPVSESCSTLPVENGGGATSTPVIETNGTLPDENAGVPMVPTCILPTCTMDAVATPAGTTHPVVATVMPHDTPTVGAVATPASATGTVAAPVIRHGTQGKQASSGCKSPPAYKIALLTSVPSVTIKLKLKASSPSLRIPEDFAKTYLKGVGGTMTVQNSVGRRVLLGHRGQSKITQDWGKFCTDNGFTTGDKLRIEVLGFGLLRITLADSPPYAAPVYGRCTAQAKDSNLKRAKPGSWNCPAGEEQNPNLVREKGCGAGVAREMPLPGHKRRLPAVEDTQGEDLGVKTPQRVVEGVNPKRRLSGTFASEGGRAGNQPSPLSGTSLTVVGGGSRGVNGREASAVVGSRSGSREANGREASRAVGSGSRSREVHGREASRPYLPVAQRKEVTEEERLAVLKEAEAKVAELHPSPAVCHQLLSSEVYVDFCLRLRQRDRQPEGFWPKENALVLLEDAKDGRLFAVMFSNRGLRSGWKNFAISHGLEESDVVVFEKLKRAVWSEVVDDITSPNNSSKLKSAFNPSDKMRRYRVHTFCAIKPESVKLNNSVPHICKEDGILASLGGEENPRCEPHAAEIMASSRNSRGQRVPQDSAEDGCPENERGVKKNEWIMEVHENGEGEVLRNAKAMVDNCSELEVERGVVSECRLGRMRGLACGVSGQGGEDMAVEGEFLGTASGGGGGWGLQPDGGTPPQQRKRLREEESERKLGDRCDLSARRESSRRKMEEQVARGVIEVVELDEDSSDDDDVCEIEVVPGCQSNGGQSWRRVDKKRDTVKTVERRSLGALVQPNACRASRPYPEQLLRVSECPHQASAYHPHSDATPGTSMPSLPSGHPPFAPHHTHNHNASLASHSSQGTSLASPCAAPHPQTSRTNNVQPLPTPPSLTPIITASPSLQGQSSQEAEPSAGRPTVTQRASPMSSHLSNAEGTTLKAQKTAAPVYVGSRPVDPAWDHSGKSKAQGGPVGVAPTAAKQLSIIKLPAAVVDPTQRLIKEFFMSKKTRAGVTI